MLFYGRDPINRIFAVFYRRMLREEDEEEDEALADAFGVEALGCFGAFGCLTVVPLVAARVAFFVGGVSRAESG